MSRALELFMEKASINEKVREAIREVSQRPLKEILAYTVKGEIDSTNLYRYLYRNLPEGYPRETFRRFISMEKTHERKVRSIFSSLFPAEEPPDVPFKSWAEVLAEGDFRLRSVGDYLKALEIAMDAEQLSEGVYTMLAEMMEDPMQRPIMEGLARDEREHYEFLKKEYDFYSKIEARKALDELVREIKGR